MSEELRGICTRNIRLVVEYDGSAFSGWQVQPGRRSVQSDLSRALSVVLRRPVGALHAAGRTDAGVHARAQVLNFSLEIPADEPINFEQLATSVSALLRGEVAVLLADEMPPMFHARSSAQSKQYSYRMVQRHLPLVLDKGRVWAVERSLDVTRMKNEASHLVGEHDLSSFRATDCASTNPVREILESELVEEPPYLIYRVVGRGFLKQMVRSIVGTLVQLGAGKLGDKTMSDILRARDRRAAGLTAPAQGLYLDWVGYPEPYKIPNEILLFGSGRRDKMQDDLVQEVPK